MIFEEADRQSELVRPGALARRLSTSIRKPFYVGLAEGDPAKVAAIRTMRWYDVMESYIYQLNSYRKRLAK